MSGAATSEASGEVTRLSLNLKRDPQVQNLILIYVAMILNHHRLCQQKHHSHLPLNLIELFQTTQQIGAFQLRVRQSLSQVLFTSFHGANFWDYWAQWVFGVLQAWQDQIPDICLTPGLLPLQPGSITWSWRETVVIQPMALEAAHQLVETLPLSAESLEMLLGLQDALVEDSSTIDPKGFEMVPLGLPLLPTQLGQITTDTHPPDLVLRHLPQMRVRFSPQTPQGVSAPQVLCHWLWEMGQRFGTEVSYVGLVLIAKMAQPDLPWQGAIACEGGALLAHFSGESESLDQDLKMLVRRLELIRHSTIRWEEQRLDQAKVLIQEEPLWLIDPLQICHGLTLQGHHGESLPYYQVGPMAAIEFSVAPGVWCDRLMQCYGAKGYQKLVQLSHLAQQLLQLHPTQQRFAAQVALFLMTQFWQGASQTWTVRMLLEAVEPPEKIQALAHHAMRRDGFFQDWTMMLSQFQALGWQISDNPLLDWEQAPLTDLGWLDESISIQLHTHSTPIAIQTGSQRPRVFSPETRISSVSVQRMDQISSQALERALTSRGMSQAKLARSLKLDRSTINRWVNGSRPIHPRYRPLLWDLLGPELRQP